MAYNNITDRTDAEGLIPTEQAQEIIASIPEQSAAQSLFKTVNMGTKTTRLPVMNALPQAFWVSGDTGLKESTEAAWKNKELIAEEIAVIVPVPESVLADTSFDMWGAMIPYIAEAFGRTLDAAVFFGTNKPSTFPAGIVPEAIAAGNVATRGTNNAKAGGIAADFSDLYSKVEEDGFAVDGVVATRGLRGALRNARNDNGTLNAEVNQNEAYGVPITYAMHGLWPTGANGVEAIAGDFASNGILGIRQDLEFKLFTEGVMSDNSGKVILNLMQQDSAALRVTARYAFAVANPVAAGQGATPYPFSVLKSPAAGGGS